MSSIKITVANQKGGVGKTTTAVTLAHGLALRENTVLLVDLDPQGQCTSHLGMDQEECVFRLLCNLNSSIRDVVRATRYPNLFILPGNKRTTTAQALMGVEGHTTDHLATLLDAPEFNSGKLHYIVMDTAPSAGIIQEMALYAADLVVIPSAVDFLALEGVNKIAQTIQALRKGDLPAVRVQPTFFDEVTKESRINLDLLHTHFDDLVLDPIHRAAALRECPPFGQTIFEHAPNSRAAVEYANLVLEVIDAI
jgi:chromosome partitioning protein